MEGLNSMGYKNPTPIQEQTIPMIMEGHDLIACAQTGTGKTAAYLLPILHRIVNTDHRHLNTLILAPTRELALQIDQQIEGLSYFTTVNSIPVYGGGDGMAWEMQKKAMTTGADIITATPGRMIAFLNSGAFDLSHLKHLVLDEADRMLDMGFFDDIIRIINDLPKDRQTLLFSATMPARIRSLAGQILRSPKEVSIEVSKPAAGILQQAYLVYDTQKEELLKFLLKNKEFQSVIIFVSTKEKVKKLDTVLRKAGLPVKAFHSDLEQAEREDILRQFKSGKLQILVGTDILSRGIDVEGISLVLNYDSPGDPEDYVHRVGRTARAAAQGTAITFINEVDQPKFFRIESMIKTVIPKIPLPEGFAPGPVYDPNIKRAQPTGKKPWQKKRKSFR
jgi:ATP-dependent RNA helicase RhlE